jgi:hypothetical protein
MHMQIKALPRPSAPLIVAILALVAALAGSAIAGSNSSPGAITKKQVKKLAKKQIDRLVPALVNERIDQRAPGLSVANAVRAGSAANAENAATAGTATSAQRADTFNPDATLRSGETLTGVWAVAGGTGASAPDAIPFTPQLAANLGAGAVHRLAPGNTSAACPGPGTATEGNLCVYERASIAANFNTISNPETGSNGANRRGAVIQYNASAANGYADGTWAVTAP